jgi:hypothetical protein
MVRSLVGNGLAPISEVIADAWWHSCYLKQPSSAIHLIFIPPLFLKIFRALVSQDFLCLLFLYFGNKNWCLT